MRVCTNPHIFFTYTLYGILPIIISTIPFIIVSVLTIINYRKAKLQEPKLTI